MTEPTVPIVCDMTTATDTPEQRLAEYHQLFGDHLVDRERVGDGIRFRFRAGEGLADEIRDLAAREKACCAFFAFDVREHGDEIWWEMTVVDDPIARQILDQMYELPDTVDEGLPHLHDRFADHGLVIVTDDDGVLRPAGPVANRTDAAR
jgi:hypothetical protein